MEEIAQLEHVSTISPRKEYYCMEEEKYQFAFIDGSTKNTYIEVMTKK